MEMRDLLAEMESAAKRAEYVATINYAADPFARHAAIRSFYANAMQEISANPAHVWAIDPYEIDWIRHFTPIESAMWGDLREEGAVMYPQFPVLNYFVDFGNPVAKVAIECDGAFHAMQREKDEQRQREIEGAGWVVFRISGSNCLRRGTVLEDDAGREIYTPSPGQSFIRGICEEFGVSGRFARRIEERRRELEWLKRSAINKAGTV